MSFAACAAETNLQTPHVFVVLVAQAEVAYAVRYAGAFRTHLPGRVQQPADVVGVISEMDLKTHAPPMNYCHHHGLECHRVNCGSENCGKITIGRMK